MAIEFLQKESLNVGALLRLAPGAFCFRRGESETIVGIDPFETIRLRAKDGNPFEQVTRRMAPHMRAPDPSLPFFQGGALGYFAYDSVRHLEDTLLLRERAGAYDAEFFLFRKVVILDSRARRIVLVGEDAADLRELRDLCAKAEAAPASGALPERELPLEKMQPLMGRERFLEGVRRLKEHIVAGDIFQAVLSERFTTPFAGDPVALFETLCSLGKSPYQFCFRSEGRVFLGASPEMLLKLTGGVLETHPIAGTRPRGTSEAEDRKLEEELLADEKERAEHLMLVDLARNDVGHVSRAGTVRVEDFMQVKRYSSVMHLVSRVLGQKRPDVPPLSALAACFPAGTLSGAPKIRAMQLIAELEPEARGFYGGAVVAASFGGEVDSCIAIRSMEISGGAATVQAGAGIVADSVPEREYDEVRHKTRAARRALGAFAGAGRGGVE